MRQAQIERALQRKLAERIERESEEARRAKEAAAERARRNRPKTPKKIEQELALFAAARVLAVSLGCQHPSLADFRECSGVPRQVSSK